MAILNYGVGVSGSPGGGCGGIGVSLGGGCGSLVLTFYFISRHLFCKTIHNQLDKLKAYRRQHVTVSEPTVISIINETSLKITLHKIMTKQGWT